MNKLASAIVPGKRLQIFDLGNVLYKVDARLSVAALQKLGMPKFDGAISNSYAVGGIFSDYCDGRVTTAQFIEGVKELCHIPNADDGQIIDAWNAMMLGFSRDSIMTVRRLRREGALVALLSNCNETHALTCRNEFRDLYPDLGAFDSLFDHVFFSQEIGMSKPKPETWQMVLDKMGVRPSDAAFYDDSEANVQQARALGIDARLFCL